jgi:hypothetical protein
MLLSIFGVTFLCRRYVWRTDPRVCLMQGKIHLGVSGEIDAVVKVFAPVCLRLKIVACCRLMCITRLRWTHRTIDFFEGALFPGTYCRQPFEHTRLDWSFLWFRIDWIFIGRYAFDLDLLSFQRSIQWCSSCGHTLISSGGSVPCILHTKHTVFARSYLR